MEIVMILTSTLLFSLQFLFHNIFEKKYGSGLQASMTYAFWGGVYGFFLMLITSGFSFHFSWFSMLLALFSALNGIVYTFCAGKAFDTANLSLFSMFAMLGGMALPFLYGICAGEDFTLMKALSFVLIAAALAITVDFKGESKKGATFYYVAIFILNGMSGVISAIHQGFPDLAIDSSSYMMITKIWTVLIVLGILFYKKQPLLRMDTKNMISAFGYSAFSSVGNLLLLLALVTLPASIQYPIVTGGVIVISTVISALRKEKLTYRDIIAAVVAFGATVLIAL